MQERRNHTHVNCTATYFSNISLLWQQQQLSTAVRVATAAAAAAAAVAATTAILQMLLPLFEINRRLTLKDKSSAQETWLERRVIILK